MDIPDGMVDAFKEGWHRADDEMGTAGPNGYRTRKGLEAAMKWQARHLPEDNDK